MTEEAKKIGGMSEEEMDAFLAGDALMRLACLDERGVPYVVPCWHEWSDGRFWVVPRARSKWALLLERDPRVGFTIDRPETVEKVIGQGRAELVERPNVGGRWVEIATRMAVRYLGEDGPRYLEPTLSQPRWLFAIVPDTIETWQGVGWARRYWVEDTGGPSWEETTR
jgi:nitroimidazol reductase NimA-like FMN-containing flavoprotein (pyridoxamine 5'-phosphate oxidase superfamily)